MTSHNSLSEMALSEMASGPPAGYVDLQTASDRQNVDLNIMGVVVDFLPPSRSRGTDYMSTFTIADSTLGGYGDGLKARFFRPMESELPCIRGTGDVIILRNIKIKPWSGMTIALSNGNTGWTVFPTAAIPESVGQGKVQLVHKKNARMQLPTAPEALYAISLCNSQDRSTFSSPIELTTAANSSLPVVPSPVVASKKQKFSLIKDVKIDSFYDLVGQIVKIYSNNGRCELYVTDYTSNSLLYNYEWVRPEGEGIARDGDEYAYTTRNSRHKHWPGPFGKMTLQVALWAPHSYFAMDNVKEEDYVQLRNVRIKFGQDARIEGTLHTDRRYPDRIDVTILKDHEDDRVKDVMRRKRDYWNKAKAQGVEFVDFVRGEKRKQPEDAEGPPKGRGKKRKQQQQQQEQQKKASRDSEAAKGHTLDRCELNKHIRCNHPAVRPRSIHNILDNDTHEITTPAGVEYRLPFQNICCRANVRVIDYFPKQLEDFAVPCKISEYDVLSDCGSSDSDRELEENWRQWDEGHGWGGEMRWEWRFYLLLEDSEATRSSSTDGSSARLKVLIAEQDAVMLLKMDAEKYITINVVATVQSVHALINGSLRKSPTALATLREKLFILWGDLEERKAAEASALKPRDANRGQITNALDGRKISTKSSAPVAKPFVCCLKEYGVRTRMVKSVGSDDCNDEAEEDANGWERRFRMFGTVIM